MSPVWILLTLLPILGGAERFACKGRILGAYYADAKSGCKAFHVCVRVAGGGVRDFRFFCPPGTLFHQEAQTCTDWGDDDPLACPADIYDGQFDLYRIGSGFDTKKLSSYGNRDDESEFGLQRAETGDRRLSQNSVAPNKPDSDLRAAHSSDFFSGQRDRGRDDSASTAQSPPASPSSPFPHSRQSFRRPTTQRTITTTQTPLPTTQRTFPTTQRTYPTTQYSFSVPSSSSQSSQRLNQDVGSKRKLVRKRPIYVSTKAPTTTVQPSVPANYPEPPHQIPQSQQNYNSQQNFKTQQNYKLQKNIDNQQSFTRRTPAQNKPSHSTTPNVPPQFRDFKDEYVEVSRVTPKSNRFLQSNTPSTPFSLSTHAQKYNHKKDGLVELYNYDAQSTPGLNVQNDNRPFKVRNSFNVADAPRDPEFTRAKNFNFNYDKDTTTNDYSFTARGLSTTTPTYKNFNSVSYEPEKNNFVSYSKQSNFNNYPTSTAGSTTTTYTTSRPESPQNLNTVAYDTNFGFFAQPNDFVGNDEDDGQYHPPEGEDDGQYRPELYDRELLAGAHSLNIAASGNRLPEDNKAYSKTKQPPKAVGQTSAPRPFRPAPSSTLVPPTTRTAETVYTTTVQPQTVNTQRTFDYFQTYTTTSRPTDYLGLAQTFAPSNEAPTRPTTTVAPRTLETRPPRPTQPSTTTPRPTTRLPHFGRPANNKEDNSYDYAYYDSDPGFSEYDHIEEFGKTNKKIS